MLTLKRMLDAAHVIVDDDRLEALTMRRLAEQLDSAHTSLYRHIDGTIDQLMPASRTEGDVGEPEAIPGVARGVAGRASRARERRR